MWYRILWYISDGLLWSTHTAHRSETGKCAEPAWCLCDANDVVHLWWHDLGLLRECGVMATQHTDAKQESVEAAAHIELHIRILLLPTASRCQQFRNFTTAHSRCPRSKLVKPLAGTLHLVVSHIHHFIRGDRFWGSHFLIPCHLNQRHIITNFLGVLTQPALSLVNATKCRKRGQRWRKRAQFGQLPSACPRPNPNEDVFGPERGQKVSEKRAEVAEVNNFWQLVVACTNKAVFNSGQRWRKWI